jgi:hypothetical protein
VDEKFLTTVNIETDWEKYDLKGPLKDGTSISLVGFFATNRKDFF